MTTLSAGLDRRTLIDWYQANRDRSRRIFGAVVPQAFYSRPIPLRHPFIFYEGHLPAFSFLVLHERALGNPALDPALEKLFERGIDPGDAAIAAALGRDDWPDRATVAHFGAACDAAVLDDLAHARLEDPNNPLLVGGEAALNILEHEEMHHETLVYLIHQLAPDNKRGPAPDRRDVLPSDPRVRVRIPAGWATLGRRRSDGFGWDNEFEAHAVEVGAFSIDRYDVTNGDYLAFVDAGGPPPAFWVRRDGEWRLCTVFDEVPLPRSWPVYVSHDEAAAYAAWAGGRLPTEAEYHRAAFGTPSGDERPYPWGDEPPSVRHGNFGFRAFDPEPVGSSPAGASAWGVEDLVGNGWEWTATPFGPLPGFRPMASYPQYSADFFDGVHYVMKGASPVTSTHLIRSSFRNWFRADYPYMYATFRCAWS